MPIGDRPRRGLFDDLPPLPTQDAPPPPPPGRAAGQALVEVGISTRRMRRVCRAVAEHLTALADELEEIEADVLDGPEEQSRG